jgi:hypothetical protein
MQLDNAIARAMLRTLLEEMSKLRNVTVEVEIQDLRMLDGKPGATLAVRFSNALPSEEP